MNFERKKFCAIMDAAVRREVATLVIAHKDWLTWIGYGWSARSCANHGCELLVLNNEKLPLERCGAERGFKQRQADKSTDGCACDPHTSA